MHISSQNLPPGPELEQALFIYPTETLYAMGAGCKNASQVRRIQEIKKRPTNKPLPLICGDMAQVESWFRLTNVSRTLARRFWPGPLSILLEPAEILPEQICGPDGLACVRISAHPLARVLADRIKSPIVSTSANFSGRPAPAEPEDIDPRLTRLMDHVFAGPPYPEGGLPSTIVRPLTDGALLVVRPGAVTRVDIESLGFTIRSFEDQTRRTRPLG